MSKEEIIFQIACMIGSAIGGVFGVWLAFYQHGLI